MSIQKLKETVKEFLEAEYSEGGYGSLTKTMFQSDYPKEDSKWNGEFEHEVLAKAKELNLKVEFVDNFGGEGCGDQYWSVYSFTDSLNVVYVQFDGWYASYVGSEYNEWFFVEPKKEVVVNFYRVK